MKTIIQVGWEEYRSLDPCTRKDAIFKESRKIDCTVLHVDVDDSFSKREDDQI